MTAPEPPRTPETYAWPLWKHLHQEHGLLLLESEIHEIIRHAAPFSAENRQLQQDIAELNTRLIERQRDMMARIAQLRNELRAVTSAITATSSKP